MTRNIYLKGRMGKLFGQHHRLNVKTVQEAMHAVDVMKGGLRQYLIDCTQNGIKFTVQKGEDFLTNEIKDEWWEAINEAMFDVVNRENGTAFWTTKNKENNISGKTGTVQVYSLSQETDEREKEDLPEHLKDHSLYIGFAPKDDPQIVIAVAPLAAKSLAVSAPLPCVLPVMIMTFPSNCFFISDV